MGNNFWSRIKDGHFNRDIFYMLLFGVLSLVFAGIKFYILGFREVISNFREIPLLISIFYIRNPLYLIGLSLITTINTSPGIPYSLNLSVHLVSLLSSWGLYYYLKLYFRSIVPKIAGWVFISILYFVLFLIPAYIVNNIIAEGFSEMEFLASYIAIFGAIKVEIIATVLVTGLYLMQFEIRIVLQEHKINLEIVVENRTAELALANKSLTYLNENLDDLVKQRSIKIEDQLSVIVRYAHMNSHEVRGPLARILGLLYIISKEEDKTSREDLLQKINLSAAELDEIIKKMNRLLEKEIFSDKK